MAPVDQTEIAREAQDYESAGCNVSIQSLEVVALQTTFPDFEGSSKYSASNGRMTRSILCFLLEFARQTSTSQSTDRSIEFSSIIDIDLTEITAWF